MDKKTIFIILAIVIFGLAGYWSLLKSPAYQTPENGLTEAQARTIAEQTCIKGGEALTSGGIYNENSKTWWFDANLNATQPGCNPACVVSEQTKTAEVNWRCTGLVEPDQGTASSTITNFDQCAAAGNPVTESYPRQCRADGQAFTEQINNKENCPPDCPMFAPPPAGWCADGEILPPLKDDCGCYGPSRCSRASQAIKQLFLNKYPNYAKTLSISIEQETDNHARGSVSFEPGAPGGIFLATKIDGAWQIVHEGNGQIPCNLANYGFPDEMLKDCAE
jgi:hypothetical protein